MGGKAVTANLADSVVHGRVMRAGRPAMAYDGGPVAAWQRKLRRTLRQRLGWSALPQGDDRPALRPRRLWRREHELGVIEKLLFTAEPGAEVPAYFCVPRDARPPYPTFICLQGHSTGMHNSIAVAAADETAPIRVEGDRDFALGCMRRGMAALCIEQRAFGQRAEPKPSAHESAHLTCYSAAMHALQLGRTLLGERVYDVDRAIDYLAGRDDIDMKRLGVMGNSGGGTTSLFAAALLPRLSAAMPSCYFCTFADSIMSIHHCLCNYVPGLGTVAEMSDIAGLIAPRPVVMVNGSTDAIFPIAAARRAFRDLKTIYRAAGAADRCRHVIAEGGHRFYADAAWPVMMQMVDP
jgi:dienelactone hydrolase